MIYFFFFFMYQIQGNNNNNNNKKYISPCSHISKKRIEINLLNMNQYE